MPLPAYLADDVRRSVAKVALTCCSKTLCGFVLGTAFSENHLIDIKECAPCAVRKDSHCHP